MYITLLPAVSSSVAVKEDNVSKLDRRLFIKDFVSYDVVDGRNLRTVFKSLPKLPDA